VKGKLLGAVPAFILLSGAAVAAPGDGYEHRKTGAASEIFSAVKDSTARVVGEFSAEITRSTQGFANAVAINNMYQVAAGRIAMERAQSPQVKAFAQKMVDAHTEMTARLKATIRNNNVNVTLADRMDARRRGMLDDLRGASSRNFDHRYLVQQIAAHKEADILIHRYAKVGKINAVREFAAKADRQVENHLSMAQDLVNRSRGGRR
jgi:putative membrane protein